MTTDAMELPKMGSPTSEKFPVKLWRILKHGKNSGAISWGPTGRSIRIHRYKFENHYLKNSADTFKTSNFNSFIRQLNLYGFRKIMHSRIVKEKDSPECYCCEYQHPMFQRNHPELLSRVQRRIKKKNINTSTENLSTLAKCVVEDSLLSGHVLLSPVANCSKRLQWTTPVKSLSVALPDKSETNCLQLPTCSFFSWTDDDRSITVKKSPPTSKTFKVPKILAGGKFYSQTFTESMTADLCNDTENIGTKTSTLKRKMPNKTPKLKSSENVILQDYRKKNMAKIIQLPQYFCQSLLTDVNTFTSMNIASSVNEGFATESSNSSLALLPLLQTPIQIYPIAKLWSNSKIFSSEIPSRVIVKNLQSKHHQILVHGSYFSDFLNTQLDNTVATKPEILPSPCVKKFCS